MNIEYYQELKHICENKAIELVAVSKTKPKEKIEELYALGQKVFGENKVQELVEKHEVLPKDIEWHFIGHLQKNKVKYIAPFISLIHSVDSLKLLNEINKRAAQNERIIPCLLQFHIAKEESKFGFQKKEIDYFSTDLELFKNVEIVGVMGMATFTEEVNIVSKEFKTLKKIFDKLKSTYFKDKENFKEISMGMSSDFKLAIENGSTMIRIGSSIFGSR